MIRKSVYRKTLEKYGKQQNRKFLSLVEAVIIGFLAVIEVIENKK